ncbi:MULTISPECIES: DUF4142 domain-containing protein [unclassified Pseudomonas]|uniref:DUF4142 domain-containing protein n=1 Tax=unclassified Pseudomonas TaxID=196821 RepID=UPI000CD0D103|nr:MULTISPECIES: DUF4142 domain-containing protein [unclassified Pseudomonas]POA54348.1 DUF305 domain-containing protein [Pseudomonas sp. FW507-12TSA]
MNTIATGMRSAGLALFLGLWASSALAQSPAAFIDDASAKGMADIEASRQAHQQTSSRAVKEYTIQVINDRTTANQHLAKIAKRLDLPVTPREQVMSKAKALVPVVAEGEDFDRAYAANQIRSTEEAIRQIRQQAQDSQLPELKAFAEETLPKLENHLQLAKALQAGRLPDYQEG